MCCTSSPNIIFCGICCLFQKRLFFRFTVVFYKCWPFSIIFDIQHTEVVCNTTIIDLPTLPACCSYTRLTWENLNCIIMTLLTEVKCCRCTRWEISSFLNTIIAQQSSDITISFSFVHTGLISGHKPGAANLGASRWSNSTVRCTSVLAHCLAGRYQCHGNGMSGCSSVVCRGLTSHSTLYKSFWGRFLLARWPN